MAANTLDTFKTQRSELQAAFRPFDALRDQVSQLRHDLGEANAGKEHLAACLSALIKALPGGVVVLDAQGIIVEINPAAAQLLGEPLLAHNFTSVLARAAAGDASPEHTQLKSGRFVSVSRRALDVSGEVILIADVTESHLTQELLNRQQRLVTLGELAAGLAHQIRTPLATALLYASQMTLADRTLEDMNRCAGKTVDSLKQLDRLVNDMLAFAHGGAAREIVSVSALLEQVAQWLRPALRQGIRLTIRTQAPNLTVRANAPSLVSAVLNLATNALQAARGDLDLELLARRSSEGRAQIVVSDNGPGIPPQLRERIFEPFFTTRAKGNGIGLAIVKSVIEAHGGSVSLLDSGPGASFVIELPAEENRMNDLTESVLVVEDDAALRDALVDTLRAADVAAIAAGDATAALQRLETEQVALVISDVQMPGPSGHQLLNDIKRLRPDLPVVLMTAYGTVAQAVSAMRDGATDYIVKPFDAQALIAMARRQLAARWVPNGMVAVDPESKRILSLARKMAETEATVLITGASGTGKEVYARFVRDHSARADKPFVAINCAAIPENMLEATLFGYEKGAFTGASAAHAGKFEQAQGGTLLLDEISEMDLGLQAKILRVLQEREVERLGSTRTIHLDVRLIATSNRDLPEEVRAGRFRADLYYRLNVMSLRLPALRERPGDILPLARRAIQACARSNGLPTLSAAAEAKLLKYEWPGNARELTNIVQRAAWLAGGQIDAADLDTGVSEPVNVESLSTDAPVFPHEPSTDPASADAGLDHDLKERERELILATLASTGGSRKLAAERLGISPRTLRHKLQQLKAAGVSVPRIHDSPFLTA